MSPCLLLGSAVLASSNVVAKSANHKPGIRNLRHRAKKSSGFALKKAPVNLGTPGQEETNDQHRRLKNGGGIFIVSHADNQGVEWCVDAYEGPYISQSRYSDGLYPNIGVKPCAFNAGPTEQLFYPLETAGGVVKISTAFDLDVCLIVEDGEGNADRLVRLGPCDSEMAEFLLEGAASDDFGIAEVGQIQPASNTDLCVTYEGGTIQDGVRMHLDSCRDTDKFKFSFRTGYYYLGYSECVAVEDNSATTRNRVKWDNCGEAGFGAHWRMDADGLFHSRLDDGYCMQAVNEEEGSPIRIYPCDKEVKNQRFTWADGFEAPVCLQNKPNLCIAPHGLTAEAGDNMVLKAADDAFEYSGDAVFRGN